MKGCKGGYWGLLALAMFLIMGCAGRDSLKGSCVTVSRPENILARVGERAITVSEFQERFNALPSKRRQGGTVEEQKEKALERLVGKTLFCLEARAQKIDREEAVESAILDTADTILAREYYKREMLSGITLTDDEIRDYYDSHPDEFKEPEMVRARHILVRVKPKGATQGQSAGYPPGFPLFLPPPDVRVQSDTAQKDWRMALTKAEDLKKQIDNGARFEKLVREKSDDGRTKKSGGDLGWISSDKMPAGFPDIVFSLKKGEISEPVKGSKGYHIIKVEMKRPGRIRAFEQEKRNLERKLKKQKQDDFFAKTIERLKEKYKVVLNTDLLTSVKVEKKKRRGG